MRLPESLLLVSDATWTGIAGGIFLLVAVLALAAEVRRGRRRQIDNVGCMPWTTVFFVAFFCAVLLLSLAAKGWSGR